MEKDFYTPKGQINDPKVAEELAHLESPARDREAALKREAEVGLTQEQEDNLAIMNGIQEKYPNALEEIIDDKGRKVLSLDVWGQLMSRENLQRIYFTQEGFFSLDKGSPNYGNEDLNIAELVDAFVANKALFNTSAIRHAHFAVPSLIGLSEKGKEHPPWRDDITTINLTVRQPSGVGGGPGKLRTESLKEMLIIGEAGGVERKRLAQEKAKKSNILSQL